MKSSNKFQIHVDPSTDATIPSGSTIADYSNFSVKFNGRLKFNKMTPLNVTIPFGWYNVNALNNKILFKDTGGTNRTATIPVGVYNASSLATAIATAMNAAGGTGTYACSYSTLTLKFTINETSGPTNFQLLFATGTAQANSLIGYYTTDHTGAATYTSDFVANVSGPNYVYISSDVLSRGGNSSWWRKGPSSVIMKVPVTVASGSTISLNNSLSEYSMLYGSPIETDNIDFKLLFQDNTPVDMSGVPWSISLLLELV